MSDFDRGTPPQIRIYQDRKEPVQPPLNIEPESHAEQARGRRLLRHYTYVGRVVYDRKKHFFTWKDAKKLLLYVLDNTPLRDPNLLQVAGFCIQVAFHALAKLWSGLRENLPFNLGSYFDAADRIVRGFYWGGVGNIVNSIVTGKFKPETEGFIIKGSAPNKAPSSYGEKPVPPNKEGITKKKPKNQTEKPTTGELYGSF